MAPEAYIEGTIAYMDGINPSECPYDTADKEYFDWMEGWREAKHHDYKVKGIKNLDE